MCVLYTVSRGALSHVVLVSVFIVLSLHLLSTWDFNLYRVHK